MKRLTTLLLAAGLVCSAFSAANAADIKAKGMWGHLPMRPPCATDYPISDFYVLPDAIRTSVPVPCGYGRCGGRENPG